VWAFDETGNFITLIGTGVTSTSYPPFLGGYGMAVTKDGSHVYLTGTEQIFIGATLEDTFSAYPVASLRGALDIAILENGDLAVLTNSAVIHHNSTFDELDRIPMSDGISLQAVGNSLLITRNGYFSHWDTFPTSTMDTSEPYRE
jgi:hypothetical protein